MICLCVILNEKSEFGKHGRSCVLRDGCMIESEGRAANCLRFCVLAPWRRLSDIEAGTRGRGVLDVSVQHLGCLLFGSALSFWLHLHKSHSYTNTKLKLNQN